MHEQILRALERSRADYTEIRIEREWRTEVAYRKNNLENLESSSELGGIVRCLVGGGWGIAVFNSLDDLDKRVEDAYRIARAVSSKAPEKAALAPAQAVQDEVRVTLKKDPRSVSLRHKQELLQKYNELMLKYSDKIVSTNARYTDSFKEVTYANSEGTFIVEERPDVTLLLSATAREGEKNIQTGAESHGWLAGFEAVENQEEKALKATQRALDLLHAKPVTAGVYTVILDPDLAGVFIHEAFGHLCEADFLFKNPRLQEVLQIGRPFGVKELNVVDDGYLPGLRGNFKYDDEGTPRQKVYLIKNGVLNSFLHSRETAAKMGTAPTGNARAVNYQFEPIVRMRNTYIEAGSATFEQMLKGIDYGIYACGSFGGQTMIEQFTFRAMYAYEIVRGQVGELVRDVVLTGNVFETLKNIEMIGNDLVIKGTSGGCGKDGQFPLPVTTGGPHVRVRNVTIGGKAA
ncbi:MAG: TldD/PmbA family protein [Candidatus Bipolaricaulota bacterium]|nr:TldD/PmbA family protein [Candidatus Bipolaricaulota bacterium]MDW8031030.1 TldD/PmbA family protein [Candidatus Bipolaricaulota bacterium]